MRITPVDNVCFSAHFPRKQRDEETKRKTMKETIKKVLESYSDCQINLASDAAREILARDIVEALELTERKKVFYLKEKED